MTVLASLTAQAFAVQSRTIPFSVAADLTRITVTLSPRAGWPSGRVAEVSYEFGGQFGGSITFDGGALLNKLGASLTASKVTVGKPLGVTAGIVTITVVQPVTTGVVVEGF